MKIIECKFYNGSVGLVNIAEMRYCYLITKDGYGTPVDEIYICFNDNTHLTLKNGTETYKTIKESKDE